MPPSSTDGPVLRIPALAAEPGLVHGFSTLAMGNMRVPVPGSDPLTPQRGAFVAALGLDGSLLNVADGRHGSRVARIDRPTGPVDGHDALVTDRPGLPLLAT